MPHAAENSSKRCTAVVITQRLISRIMCIVVSFHAFSTAFRWRHRLLAAGRRRAARDRAGRTRLASFGARKKVGTWSGCPGGGLRQDQWRERNIMVEIQKFCKMLSRGSGHGKSVGFAVSHPFTGKDDTMAGTHHHSKRARSRLSLSAPAARFAIVPRAHFWRFLRKRWQRIRALRRASEPGRAQLESGGSEFGFRTQTNAGHRLPPPLYRSMRLPAGVDAAHVI